MSVQKNRNYKLSIIIHQISISVKFPCSVSIALKTSNMIQQKNQTSNREFKLDKGVAKINQQLVDDVSMKYNSKLGMFSEEKISLIVYLKSSSGKIPAGSASIMLKSDKPQQKMSVGIEKCPDRAAKIQYSFNLKFINEQQLLEQSFLSKSSVQYPIVNTECKTPTQRSNADNNYRRSMKPELYNSRVSSQTRNFFNDDQSQRSETGSQSRISRMIMKEHEQQTQSQRKKIMQLQRQKSKAMKEIRGLKNQLQLTNSLKNSNISIADKEDQQALLSRKESKISLLEDQLDKDRSKISDYQAQLHRNKIKIQELERDYKNMQKKYKQATQSCKNSDEQKSKIMAKNKQISIELREIKQKYEDYVLMHDNYQKRYQFKENVYKQQIKASNQKYAASESQKQKLLFQKNQMLNSIEAKTMKQKQISLNKDRVLQQQKNKLHRRVQYLEKQLLTLKDQKQNSQQNTLQLQLQNHRYKLSSEENTRTIQQLNKQIEQYRRTMENRQRQNKKILDELRMTIQKNINENRQLKKQINQKQYQYTENNRNITKLQANKKIITKKCQQLEHQLRQKSTALSRLQRQYDMSNRKLRLMQQKMNNNSNQNIQDVTFMKSNNNIHQQTPYFNSNPQPSQISATRSRIKTQTAHHAQQTDKLKSQLKNLKLKISQQEQQNQEMSQKNFRLNDQLVTSQKKYEQIKSEYLQLQCMYKELTKQRQELIEHNQNLMKQIDDVLAIKTEIQENYQQQLIEKGEQIGELEAERHQNQIIVGQLRENGKVGQMAEMRVRELEEQLKAKNRQIEKLVQELEQVEEKLLRNKIEYQAQIQSLNSNMIALEGNLQNKNQQLVSLSEQFMVYKDKSLLSVHNSEEISLQLNKTQQLEQQNYYLTQQVKNIYQKYTKIQQKIKSFQNKLTSKRSYIEFSNKNRSHSQNITNSDKLFQEIQQFVDFMESNYQQIFNNYQECKMKLQSKQRQLFIEQQNINKRKEIQQAKQLRIKQCNQNVINKQQKKGELKVVNKMLEKLCQESNDRLEMIGNFNEGRQKILQKIIELGEPGNKTGIKDNKIVAKDLKQLQLAFQRLKIVILAKHPKNTSDKETVVEEFRKVQAVLQKLIERNY